MIRVRGVTKRGKVIFSSPQYKFLSARFNLLILLFHLRPELHIVWQQVGKIAHTSKEQNDRRKVSQSVSPYRKTAAAKSKAIAPNQRHTVTVSGEPSNEPQVERYVVVGVRVCEEKNVLKKITFNLRRLGNV